VETRVGNVTDVAPGQMRRFQVESSAVTIANVAGRFYAFDDTFSHLGCSLGKGTLEGTTVTCPCHGSKLDVTSGAVIRGPATRPVRSRMVQVEGEDLLATAE